MDAAWAALLGGAIGVVGTLGAAWIAGYHQRKRDLVKMAVDLGLAEHRFLAEAAARAAEQGRRSVLPTPTLFVWYAAETLQAIESGKYDAAKYLALAEKREQIRAAMRGQRDAARLDEPER